jgi:flavin-dependent dehydrogenase
MTSSIRDSPLKVAVVGAGPAGCAAALTLGQENIDVILLEKGPPNKDKACGDALVPAALEMFAYFGLDEDCISELGGRRYDDISLTFGDSDIWKAQHESSQGWVIPRVVLDQRFRELTSAYAEIMYETRVTNVRRNIDGSYGVTIRRRGRYEEEKLRCSAVILANGATGKFASDVGVSGAPLIGASITAYSELKEPDGLVFRFNESYLPGYS